MKTSKKLETRFKMTATTIGIPLEDLNSNGKYSEELAQELKLLMTKTENEIYFISSQMPLVIEKEGDFFEYPQYNVVKNADVIATAQKIISDLGWKLDVIITCIQVEKTVEIPTEKVEVSTKDKIEEVPAKRELDVPAPAEIPKKYFKYLGTNKKGFATLRGAKSAQTRMLKRPISLGCTVDIVEENGKYILIVEEK